jgi:hypothetical protein
MAATGIFINAVNTVKASLTALGLKPVTDPRNARPLTVMIELPTFTSYNYNIGDIRITLRVLGAPSGNQDTGDYLLSVTDAIMNSPIAVLDGRPSIANYGGQDLPCYDLTIGIAGLRN